ncbi:MAG: SBBP repeat-containing protein, partial [Bacteroidota bacterium]|nr:SBBP repeat-containing protein [Bacteroidota bacterium]
MGNYFINIRYQILVVLLSLITLSTYAQKSKWANNAGSGTTSDQGNSIAVDQCGNSYVTGYFKNTGKFGNFSVKSSGESDIFISKYNTFGNIRWVRSMGGGKDDIGNGVAADINGNVFVTGYIQDTVRIGAITLISKGKKDFFIAKYDSIGNLLWAKSGGSANNDEEGIAVQSDLSGNCYITGYFQGKLNYGTDSIISKGDKDIFVMKLDVNGNMIWLKQIGGSLEDNVSGLAIDNTGNIYLTGYFRSTILYFGSTPLSNFGTNFNDVFIACYKPNGNLSWTKDAGGPSDEISNAIAVDLYDNVYITGIFYDADANFDGIKPKYYGQSDIFIAKYDQNQKLLWVKSAGGIKTDISTGIAVDFQKNIFITGYFEETSNFGSSTLTSAGNHDIFIAKYDSLGKNLWTTSAGNLKDDYSMSIGVDPMGNCYLTGSFNDKIKFDSINLLTVDGNPGQDIFITKYGLDIPCTLKADAGADQTINFGSNAIISASATGGNTYFYSWGNGIGYTKNRVVSPTITTVYKLTVTSLPSGCSSIDSVTINISTSACQVDVGSDKTICRGDTVSLSVSGGDTYKWNNGLGTNSSIIDIPQITTIYRVTLTKGGCTSSDMVIINVIDATTADFNYDVVDLGNATHFTDMSVQGGGSLNHWYWQFGDSGTSSIENPSHIYSSAGTKNVCLSVEDTRGCKASICKNVTVNQPGACKANAGNDKTICRGDTITLSASGGDYYSWSSGANTPNTTIVPNTTTTYIVSVISNGTCFASDNVVITVNPIPVANAGSDVTINSGASTTLPASGGGTYSWSNNKTTASISVNPTITTTYFVTVSNNGCSNSAKVVVNVNATCSAYAGQDVTICKGNSATLNASGGNSYKWSNNQTTTSISVNPTITTTYIVTATTGTCTASDNVVVTVNPIQVANAGSDVTINSGASTTLTASGGGTYSWSNNKTTASISVNPTITTTYFVTVKNNGCSNSAKVVVNVNATCSAYAGQDVTICKGNSATLNASGGNS